MPIQVRQGEITPAEYFREKKKPNSSGVQVTKKVPSVFSNINNSYFSSIITAA